MSEHDNLSLTYSFFVKKKERACIILKANTYNIEIIIKGGC